MTSHTWFAVLALLACCTISAARFAQSTKPQADAPTSQPDPNSERIVNPFPDITVRLKPGDPSIEIRAWTCLDSGFVEQIACSPQTREHESLLVVKAKPSQIHAALLMAGFAPGSPGRWTYENDVLGTVDPTGEKLAILIRYADAAKPENPIERPVRDWLRSATTDPAQSRPFPEGPWVFGGSIIRKNPAHMEQGEHYVADMTGSIIGVVTFGDEVIGYSKVISDQESIESPLWEVNPETIPPPGTEVVLVVRKWQQDRIEKPH